MDEMRCDVAVIGAGTAGLHAYRAAVAAGAETIIIEEGEGGSTCTRTGCMPSKALIAAGRAAVAVHGAGRFGVETGAVAIDGAAVMRRVRAERDHFTEAVLREYHAIPAEKRLHGTARFERADLLRVGETLRVRATAVVIAVGSAPVVPDVLARIAPLVRTSDTIFELSALPASLGVIGAGALGLELAQAFARLGVNVTVLDEGDAIGGLADPIAEAAARGALGSDMALHTGVRVVADMAGDRARLRWSGASRGETLVDLVLVASGRRPALDRLDLAHAGLPLDEQGIPRALETSRRAGDTNVYVAGDAGGWRPVLHEAARGGRIAGRTAAGGPPRWPIPRLTIAFTEPNLVEVGARFDALPDGARIGEAKVADNGRARIDGEEAGIVRLYADAHGVLIGGVLVATEAEHLGQTLAMAVQCGIDAATLADMAWYHPTLQEMLQAAARDLDPAAARGA